MFTYIGILLVSYNLCYKYSKPLLDNYYISTIFNGIVQLHISITYLFIISICIYLYKYTKNRYNWSKNYYVLRIKKLKYLANQIILICFFIIFISYFWSLLSNNLVLSNTCLNYYLDTFQNYLTIQSFIIF